MSMGQRKKEILEAIIKSYIETAEPIGSRTISRKYDLGVSPATIRNEMSDLEELGFIEQPHTSSGRIPSDKGYRYYVDCLMEDYALNSDEVKYVQERYAEKVEQIEHVIERTGQLLAGVTDYVALVMAPQVKQNFVKYVRLLSLSPGNALLVMVLQGGVVQHRTVEIPEKFTFLDLERISNVLNHKLQGHAVEELKQETFREIYRELVRERIVAEKVVEMISASLAGLATEKVYLGGTTNILNQPEFRDVDKVRGLLNMLEEKELVRQLLEDTDSKGLTIKIGGENRQEGINQ